MLSTRRTEAGLPRWSSLLALRHRRRWAIPPSLHVHHSCPLRGHQPVSPCCPHTNFTRHHLIHNKSLHLILMNPPPQHPLQPLLLPQPPPRLAQFSPPLPRLLSILHRSILKRLVHPLLFLLSHLRPLPPLRLPQTQLLPHHRVDLNLLCHPDITLMSFSIYPHKLLHSIHPSIRLQSYFTHTLLPPQLPAPAASTHPAHLFTLLFKLPLSPFALILHQSHHLLISLSAHGQFHVALPSHLAHSLHVLPLPLLLPHLSFLSLHSIPITLPSVPSPPRLLLYLPSPIHHPSLLPLLH